jgi:NAD+ diphosphatase
MRKIIEKEFKSYYEQNAMFFNRNTIFTYPNQTSPLINFKAGLDCFVGQIQEVFLFQNRLFVEVAEPEHANLISYSAKIFLRGLINDEVNIMLQAIQWLTWNKRNNYCSKCGNSIALVQNVSEKKCHSCNLSFFPSLSPAVMVLVKKENKILLARSPHFRAGMYSALAGFVDIGETAEYAAHREVQEEVGLKITSLKYFGSQSWPFPSSFMIAFTAEYLDGKIIMEPNEIEDAKWFDVNQLPDLPSMPSISRRLINSVSFDLSGQCNKAT